MQRGNWLNQRLADLVWLTHVAITLLVGFGWLGPTWALWGVIAFGLAIEIQWRVTGSWCVLGDLERWLRDETRPDRPEEQGFVKRLIKTLLRIDISPDASYKLTHIWIKVALGIAAVRLLILYS